MAATPRLPRKRKIRIGKYPGSTPNMLMNTEAISGPAIRKYFTPYLSERYPNAGWVRLLEMKFTAVKILTRKRESSSFAASTGMSPTIKLE